MENEPNISASDRAELSAIFDKLVNLATTSPYEALREIDRRAQAMRETAEGLGDGRNMQNWAPHVLYFLAYGRIAQMKYEEAKGRGTALQQNVLGQYRVTAEGAKIVDFCKRALEEYKLAKKCANYTDVQTYQETVTINPAGFFRKAVTQVQDRTRHVTKCAFDFETCESALNCIIGVLEEVSPGASYEAFGYIKLKHLLALDRVAIQTLGDSPSERDIRKIGELPVRMSRGRVVRSASIIFAGIPTRAHLVLRQSTDPKSEGKKDDTEFCWLTRLDDGTWKYSRPGDPDFFR